MGENGWLLIKHQDEFVSVKDITKDDKSFLSGKPIAIMEKTSEKVWKGGREQKIVAPKKGPKQKGNDGVGEDETTPAKDAGFDVDALLKRASMSKTPTGYKRMRGKQQLTH